MLLDIYDKIILYKSSLKSKSLAVRSNTSYDKPQQRDTDLLTVDWPPIYSMPIKSKGRKELSYFFPLKTHVSEMSISFLHQKKVTISWIEPQPTNSCYRLCLSSKATRLLTQRPLDKPFFRNYQLSRQWPLVFYSYRYQWKLPQVE